MYLVLFSLLLVATDLWSKSYFPTLVHNTGVSFGMQLSQWIIASIYILAAGYLLATVFVQDKWKWGAVTAGYMMIFSGLIGNAYDRIVYDAVRDWLDIIPHFPVFNIADVCISLGVSLILITEWRVKKKEENKKHTE